MSEMIVRVAKAIEATQLFSRYNDGPTAVAGLPIEICRYGRSGEPEIVVLERHGRGVSEREALHAAISEARARAAIETMRGPTNGMAQVGTDARWRSPVRDPDNVREIWNAMIDAALSEKPE